MPINYIIVEDEPLAASRIKNYAGRFPFLNLVAVFETGEQALAFLAKEKVDLIFLDINLGAITGMQLLETAKLTAEVIITTAYDEYALKGFDLKVADYLLKPFVFERFAQAVEHAKNNIAKKDAAFIFIKTENRLEKLLLHDVLYIEGVRSYRKIHTLHKKILTLQTFIDFEKEIPGNIICRVHKSYMLALNKVELVEKGHAKIGNVLIPISDTYKKQFLQLLQGNG
jgi:two-component system LytT family response regulator